MSDSQMLIASLREYNDLGNCMWCMAKADGTILYTAGRGWMMWSGTHWRQDEPGVVRFVSSELVARASEGVKTQNEQLTKTAFPSATHVKSVVYLLQSHVNTDVAEFVQVPHHLNFLNGVVDLRTGDIIPHHHSQRQCSAQTHRYIQRETRLGQGEPALEPQGHQQVQGQKP